MTSSRVVRGTKGRIILCICAILIITGIVACYNNTLSQLDDIRRANDQCHQQQENLSTQLQVIFDYKQRLEKSLKTEKAEHQQSKKELERKLNEQRTRYENVTNEANTKFLSLQQHFNLLQTEHDDLKETKRLQTMKVNDLQSELAKVQNQLKQSISQKDEKFENLKNDYMELQTAKENLEKQLKGTQNNHFQYENDVNRLTKINHELQREIEKLKTKQSKTFETIQEPQEQSEKTSITKHPAHITANFSKQVDLGDSVYQIRDSQNNPVEPKQDPSNVADLPSNAEELQQGRPDEKHHVEQFNNNENVLIAPNDARMQLMNQKSSSTTKSSVNNKSVSKASLDVVQPLNMPTVTPSSVKNKPSQESRIFNQDPRVLPLPYAHKKLPSGVVPAPNTPLEIEEGDGEAHKPEEDEVRDDVNNALPNRYRNNLILNELAKEQKLIEPEKQDQINEPNQEVKQQNLLKSDVGDKENNAVEIVDPPVNNDKGLEPDPFGLDEVHNNNDKVNLKRSQEKVHKPHVNNLLGVDGGQGNRIYDAQESVDYEKNAQLEENDPDGDDDPEYADHIARQKDPAVRN